MKNYRFLVVLTALCAFLVFLLGFSVGGNAEAVYDYSVSAIYKYNGRIDAVDITKTGGFIGKDDVLLVVARKGGQLVRAKAVPLDEDMPVGINEIPIPDFEVEEGQEVFVTVWDSISSITPLTNGEIPELTIETNRVSGSLDEWEISPDGKRIIAYIGEENEVVIPNYINGKHITTIGAYSSQNNMISIFGDRAEEITALRISDGIKKIGPTAFYGCKAVESPLSIPESVDYIGAYSFYNCIKMTGDVVIPKGVEYIYPATFAGCFKITSVSFPDSLKSIGDYGFYGCLEMGGALEIPKSVSYIGEYAFLQCESLTGDLSLEGVSYIGKGAFGLCSSLNGELILSENLEYIGCMAFENCIRLTGELVLPESLIYIGDAAFNHCGGFTNETLIIPENVAILGGDLGVEVNTGYSSHLFYDFGKDSLFKAFYVADGNENFCAINGVLYDAKMERLIAYPRGKTDDFFEIPEGITQLDELAFSKCKFLREIVLPDSYVIKVRPPKNVINQNGNTLAVALYNYTGVEKVLVKETNPRYVSEDGILYSKDGKSLWYCPVKIGGDVKISSGTERVESGAIYGVRAENEISSLHVPETVSYIAPETVSVINILLKGNISVDEGNAKYCIRNEELKAVN